jgi:hypothetical protein
MTRRVLEREVDDDDVAYTRPTALRPSAADPDYCTLCRQLGPCINCDTDHARWSER